MDKTFDRRLAALEALERAQQHDAPTYIALAHVDDPLPPGWAGKVYIGVSPDEWDTPENCNSRDQSS